MNSQQLAAQALRFIADNRRDWSDPKVCADFMSRFQLTSEVVARRSNGTCKVEYYAGSDPTTRAFAFDQWEHQEMLTKINAAQEGAL